MADSDGSTTVGLKVQPHRSSFGSYDRSSKEGESEYSKSPIILYSMRFVKTSEETAVQPMRRKPHFHHVFPEVMVRCC